MRFLALDVGSKRIGVARGDSNTRIAVPLGFIAAGASQWQEIARLEEENATQAIIIGLPRNNSGQKTAQSTYVENFARALLRHLPGRKIYFQDETLTSVLAEERLKSRGQPYKRGDIDAEAAAIILQDFLESYQPAHTQTTAAPQATAERPDTVSSSLEAANQPNQGETMPKTAKKPHKSSKTTAKGPKTSKNHPKSQKSTRIWCSALIIVLILAVLGVGAFFAIRELRRAERAAYYAEQEANLEPQVFDFTVKPGEVLSDVRQHLLEVGYSETEVDNALAADYDFPMLSDRPAGATLEGYLFGETQQFYLDAPATEVIAFFLSKMQDTIDQNNLASRYAAQGLDMFEGVTLASVIQQESPTSEMPTVAQVFLTRLEAGIPLGSDVTVSYALDDIDPERENYSDNASALTVDSCYNTRLYLGLPCGPIASPGLEALLAVAEPSNTSYLYFLTGDDGLMYYSYTEDEHERNAAEHCQNLCAVSL